MNAALIKTIAVCDTEPIAVEGVRGVIAACEDLRLVNAGHSLMAAMEMAERCAPDVMIIDKAFGIHAIMEWIRRMRAAGSSALVWGVNMSEAEAMRLVQAGARGVVRKSADVITLVAAIRMVAAGATWIEDCLMRETDRTVRSHRSNLTGRELQVLELVEQGMRNKDIGEALGIQAGTVKIHMKHIFEKTGIRGRYGLALSGLKEKGLLSLPTM